MGRVRLTLKMRMARNHFIEYGNKTEAYRHAYNCAEMKEKTIGRKAAELFDLPHVMEAVMLMQMRQDEQFDVKIFEVKQLLVEIAYMGMKMKRDAQDNLVPVDLAAARGALAEINRMGGHYLPSGLGSDLGRPGGEEGAALPAPGAPAPGAPADGAALIELDVTDYKRIRSEVLACDDC